MKRSIWTLFLFLFASTVYSKNLVKTTAEYIDEGISAYDEGDFYNAVGLFSKAVESNQLSNGNFSEGHLLFNLGNAYYKNSESAGAIAAYLAAKRFLPRDADLNANLKIVSKTIKDDIDMKLSLNSSGEILPFLEVLTVGELKLVVASVFVVFAMVSLLVKNSELRNTGRAFLGAGILWAIVGLFIIGLKKDNDIAYATARTNSLSVMSSPGKAGIELFKVNSGTPMSVLSKAGPYLKTSITLKNGELKKGWVKTEDIYLY